MVYECFTYKDRMVSEYKHTIVSQRFVPHPNRGKYVMDPFSGTETKIPEDHVNKITVKRVKDSFTGEILWVSVDDLNPMSPEIIHMKFTSPLDT